jgi:hypothetical protein
MKRILFAAIIAVLLLGVTAEPTSACGGSCCHCTCDCSLYNFNVKSDGTVRVENQGGNDDQPPQYARVYIDGVYKGMFSVPAMPGGTGWTVIGTVSVPDSGFDWEVVGTKRCSDSGHPDDDDHVYAYLDGDLHGHGDVHKDADGHGDLHGDAGGYANGNGDLHEYTGGYTDGDEHGPEHADGDFDFSTGTTDANANVNQHATTAASATGYPHADGDALHSGDGRPVLAGAGVHGQPRLDRTLASDEQPQLRRGVRVVAAGRRFQQRADHGGPGTILRVGDPVDDAACDAGDHVVRPAEQHV